MENQNQREPIDLNLPPDAINSNPAGKSKRQMRIAYRKHLEPYQSYSSTLVDLFFDFIKDNRNEFLKQQLRLKELNRMWKAWLRNYPQYDYNKCSEHFMNKVKFLIDMSRFTPEQQQEIDVAGNDPKENIYPEGKSVNSKKVI